MLCKIRCQYPFVVAAVLRDSGKLFVKGSLCAALTVYHVTVARLVIRQVMFERVNTVFKSSFLKMILKLVSVSHNSHKMLMHHAI